MNAAIEAGAEDFTTQGDQYEILTEPESFHAVLESSKKRVSSRNAELSMIPQNYIKLEANLPSR